MFIKYKSKILKNEKMKEEVNDNLFKKDYCKQKKKKW